MTDLFINLISFVVALGILVFVHEYGHYWVARKNNVKVLRFAIGFGKPIYRWLGKDGTEYVIGIIPLGGYVRMLDGRVDSLVPGDEAYAFDQKPVLSRIAIVAAGPMANFIFAIFLVFLMLIMGVPAVKPVIGEITAQSPAAEAGLQAKDEIAAINSKSVNDWTSFQYALMDAVGDETISLQVTRNGQSQYFNLKGIIWNLETGDLLKDIGITPFSPKPTLTLNYVDETSAAHKSGVKAGDRIVSIDNELITSWEQAVEIIMASADKTVLVALQRGNQIIELEVTPENRPTEEGFSRGYFGVAPEFEEWPKDYVFTNQYAILPAIKASFIKTWDLISLTFNMIGKFITGAIGLENLSGPIAIAQGAGLSAQSGLVYFISFMALISVNLGVVNLLPLPVLDGGHLMYFIIELIRGKPVSERVQEMGFRIGAFALMFIMGIALFNDFGRL